MTLVEDRPTDTRSVDGPSAEVVRHIPAWRLALRLARRETVRRPGRTVLAAMLIAAPVFAMTVGSVLVRTDRDSWQAQFERDYDGADIVVNAGSLGFSTAAPGPDNEVNLPVGTIVDEYFWTSTPVTPSVPIDEANWWGGTFTDIELVGSGAGQPIAVREGRAPRVGEILLDARTADDLGVEIGDTVALDRPAGTWTLSGIGRNRQWHDERVFVVPGFDVDRIRDDFNQSVVTYDLPDDVSNAEIRSLASRLGGVTRFDDVWYTDQTATQTIAWGWVSGVLALVAVGIIVAAAFATSARRQLVVIGQLTSNGATPNVIRRTLALQGTWTGLIGAVVGVVAGLAALPFSRRWIEVVMGGDIPPYDVRVVDVFIIVATATVAGTVAAAVPARSASRIPVMAALAGRRPLGRPPAWLVPTGLGLLGGGLGLAALAAAAASGSSGGNDNLYAFLIVLGIVSVVFGMCCAMPLLVERIGSIGNHTSLSWRLGLRSLSRARTRSSAVLAAIAVAVAGSVAAAALVEAAMAENRVASIPVLPANAAVVEFWSDHYVGDEPVDLPALADVVIDQQLRSDLEAVAPGATFEPLRVATVNPPPYDPASPTGIWPERNGPLIADEALLDVLGLDPVDVRKLEETGALLPVSPEGYVPYFGSIADGGSGGDAELPAMQFADERGTIELVASVGERPYQYGYAGFGGGLITEAKAIELGFTIVERGAIVRADDALTADQRDVLQSIRYRNDAESFDAFIEPGDPLRTDLDAQSGQVGDFWNIVFDQPEWRDQGNDVWVARAVIVGAALLIVMLVVAIGLSLAAAEGRGERNTLVVVGATPASMRRQAAAKAAVLALVGIAVGIPTGFVPAWVLYRTVNGFDSYGSTTLGFPLLVVGSLIVVVPATVATFAWVTSAAGQRFRPPAPTTQD